MKVPAVGDSRIREKKITAPLLMKEIGLMRMRGKGEKVCVRDHQPTGDRRAVLSGCCKFVYTIVGGLSVRSFLGTMEGRMLETQGNLRSR